MASSDWLDIRGWTESIIGWSMDKTHDILPSSDIDLEFSITRPRWFLEEPIVIGSEINLQSGFADIQPSLEAFFRFNNNVHRSFRYNDVDSHGSPIY